MDISIWEKESFYAPQDIIIVGSGFVGLWCAYYLKKRHPGDSITIVDRGIIPTGASTRNAGFACFGSVSELRRDVDGMGENKMLELVEMRFRGLQKIQNTFSRKEIEYIPSGGFELITSSQRIELDKLRSDIDWLNQRLRKIVGRKKAFYMADSMIPKLGLSGVAHLVENRLEGQLHAGKLCKALARKVLSMGVSILNNFEVKGYEKANGKILIHSNLPIDLCAAQLLICTNGFAKQLLPGLDVDPARGQILVTSPLDNIACKGTFHYDEGYYYFRDLGDRILLGGARNKAFAAETTFDLLTSEQIQNELENFLRAHILGDQAFSIDYRWSGIMGIGSEKMPIVQLLEDNVYCAVRMSGMGVALAPVIGKMVSSMM